MTGSTGGEKNWSFFCLSVDLFFVYLYFWLSIFLFVCLCLFGYLYFWFSVYRSFCNWRVHGPIGREDQRRHWKQVFNRNVVERPNWNSSRTSTLEIISSSKDRIETCYWSRCRLEELGPEMFHKGSEKKIPSDRF